MQSSNEVQRCRDSVSRTASRLVLAVWSIAARAAAAYLAGSSRYELASAVVSTLSDTLP